MSNDKKPEVLEKEQSSVPAELIAQGHSLVRLENDKQLQIAIQRPRDESRILEQALKELETYPSLCDEVLYNKPVGKDESGQMKYAEGLSIRTAESLANRWDNSAYGCDIIADTDDEVTLAAVFLDYEKNTRHMIQKRVSKFYKTRDNKVVRYAPDRFDTILSANQSKILRECILRSLPAGLKKEYELKARTIAKNKMKGDKQLKGRIEEMLKRFAEYKISKPELEILRNKKIDAFTADDVVELVGVYNALKDGQTTYQELFGESDKKKAESEAPPLTLKGE